MTSLRLLDHGLCGWREARLSRFVTNRTITSRRVIDCYDKSPKSTQFLFHTAYFWICLMFLYLLDFHDWYYRSVIWETTLGSYIKLLPLIWHSGQSEIYCL